MKWISRIVMTITVLISLFAAVFIVPRVVGINPYIILSGSMEPTIETGSVVFINTKDKDIHKDDIICFHIGEEGKEVTVTHRAVEVEDGVITTKGDNNEMIDANQLTEKNIVGKYMTHIPKVGYLMSKINQKQKIAIIIALFAANGVCFCLENFLEEDEEDEEKEEEKKEEPVLEVESEVEDDDIV